MQITTIVQNDKEFADVNLINAYSNNKLASDDFHVYLENMREEKACTKVFINNNVKYTKEILLSMLEDMRTSQNLKVVTVQFYDKEFTFEITQVITCKEDFPADFKKIA